MCVAYLYYTRFNVFGTFNSTKTWSITFSRYYAAVYCTYKWFCMWSKTNRFTTIKTRLHFFFSHFPIRFGLVAKSYRFTRYQNYYGTDDTSLWTYTPTLLKRPQKVLHCSIRDAILMLDVCFIFFGYVRGQLRHVVQRGHVQNGNEIDHQPGERWTLRHVSLRFEEFARRDRRYHQSLQWVYHNCVRLTIRLVISSFFLREVIQI